MCIVLFVTQAFVSVPLCQVQGIKEAKEMFRRNTEGHVSRSEDIPVDGSPV